MRALAVTFLKKTDELIAGMRSHNETQSGQEPYKFRAFRETGQRLKLVLQRDLNRPQPRNINVGKAK